MGKVIRLLGQKRAAMFECAYCGCRSWSIYCERDDLCHIIAFQCIECDSYIEVDFYSSDPGYEENGKDENGG